MRRTPVIAVVALTAASIALGQEQSATRDQKSGVEQAIRQLDNERIQARIGADAVALDRFSSSTPVGLRYVGIMREYCSFEPYQLALMRGLEKSAPDV